MSQLSSIRSQSHLCDDVQVQLSYFLLLCVCLCCGTSSQISWCSQYLIQQRVCKLLCVLSVVFLLQDLLIMSQRIPFFSAYLTLSVNVSEVSLLNFIWLSEQVQYKFTCVQVDPIIEGSTKFVLLNQRDVRSSESTDYSQLFIEPDADVFEMINRVPSSRKKLCLVCY